jgi:aspartyl-tRNA(Asn)/glutamyl-tRNA(Gln) amidotransferase subunit B
LAKTAFKAMWESGASADQVIETQGLYQMTDNDALDKAIIQVIAAYPEQVNQFRAGKDKMFGFFVGQVMKATRGKANPQQVNDLLRKRLQDS